MHLGGDQSVPDEAPMPRLADFSTRNTHAGFSIDLSIRLDSLEPGQIILDSRTETETGIVLRTTARGTLKLVLNDGRSESGWDCDPGMLGPGKDHHLVIIVDGGPRIISFVVDGVLCDGGGARPFGGGRLTPYLQSANGAEVLRMGPTLRGEISSLRIYDRALLTGEAIANHRAGAG